MTWQFTGNGIDHYTEQIGHENHVGAYRIGYSNKMNGFWPTRVHAISHSVARRDEVYTPPGVTRELTSVVRG